MDTRAYLNRIGINEELKPDLESLRLIQSRHLLSIPFENLNIHIYNRLSPDPEELFDKIVLQRRGGVCYELNYLYMLLLEEMGYDISLHGGKAGDNGSFFDHSFPIVNIDGQRYITDVGFGDNFLYPLEFKPDVPQFDPKGIFTVEYEGGGYYSVYKELEGKRFREYTFPLNKRKLSDFNDRKVFYTTDPSSHFFKNLIVSMELENGRISLKQNKLLFTEGKERRWIRVESFNHYVNLLFEYFGIVLTPSERRKLKHTKFWNKRHNRKKTHALLLASSVRQNFSNRIGSFLGE
ncbi:MAG: arylamine N-acetyltransferase [Spirochaetales bacterium]|uniref:Arylamine N-acetyltransferase n=1 Tax=Candidatus Thalassospirochaeta sargassi TaxID=3119039 RepID=A0AAJ1ML01_9SPIO|nr:arylamine N-acetyltransferase [Spirochaetales bacterium]